MGLSSLVGFAGYWQKEQRAWMEMEMVLLIVQDGASGRERRAEAAAAMAPRVSGCKVDGIGQRLDGASPTPSKFPLSSPLVFPLRR